MTNNDWKEKFKGKPMRRLLVSIVILLCLSSISFAAPKKKKSAPMDDAPEVTFDVDSCVDKAIDYRTLLTTNPYDNVGKCYWLGFPMVKTQLFSRSVALIGFAGAQQNVFALMDFGKESVPMSDPITGLVMGLGAYEYTAVDRSRNTVHHLRKLDGYLKRTKSQQKEKDARDKKAAEEQAKQLELAHKEEQQALERQEKERQELAQRKKEQLELEQLEKERLVKEKNLLEEKERLELAQKKKEQLELAQKNKERLDREKEEKKQLVREQEEKKDISYLLHLINDGEYSISTADKSGLMLLVFDKHNLYNWNTATELAKIITVDGYSDWRLPTIKELFALLNPEEKLLKKLSKQKGNSTYQYLFSSESYSLKPDRVETILVNYYKDPAIISKKVPLKITRELVTGIYVRTITGQPKN
jgi:hypothetical protein